MRSCVRPGVAAWGWGRMAPRTRRAKPSRTRSAGSSNQVISVINVRRRTAAEINMTGGAQVPVVSTPAAGQGVERCCFRAQRLQTAAA